MTWSGDSLLKEIYKLGIRGLMFNFIDKYINGRSFRVNVGGSFSLVTNLEHGIPKGSIIAPTLLSIYINDLAMADNKKYRKY